MSDLGALLRKAREQHGLSLEDVQETTKIRKRYLEAIESGDHSILPGTFYLRAFVKNYCEAVGLDPDEVLRLYQHELPASVTDQIVDPVTTKPPRRVQSQSSERISKLGFNVMMWSFLILIVVVVWIFFVNRQDDAPKQTDKTNITDASSPPEVTNNPNSGAGTPTPVPTPTPQVPQETTTVTFESKKGKVDHYVVGPAGSAHKLEIKVTGGPSWTEVRTGSKDGKALISENVKDGSVLSYDLTESLYVNVGRADLTAISIDGVAVADGDRAGSKKIQFNPVSGDVTVTVTPTPADTIE
ncbi:MAG: RodZ domain-containing protein [Candidatus Pristimantibacillus sp.]